MWQPYSRPDSLANSCKIIIIFTRFCVFYNKLFKLRPYILHDHLDCITSAISLAIMLLYQIYLIFQILVRPRQELELLAYGSQLKSDVSILYP